LAKREVGSIDSDAMETNDGANDDYVGSEAFEMKRVMLHVVALALGRNCIPPTLFLGYQGMKEKVGRR
jgi:hypothetical protein